MEFNHWLRGYLPVPPTFKEGVERDRHFMAWVLRAVNSFEDLGFRVDCRSITIDPCELMGTGCLLGFRYRVRGSQLNVWGV